MIRCSSSSFQRNSLGLLLSPRHLTYARTLPTNAKVTVPPRRTVSPQERAELRFARKKQADATLRQAQQKDPNTAAADSSSQLHTDSNTASTSTVLVSTKKPWDSRIVYGLGVGIPTMLLSWAIYDDQSPPAKLARTIGITGFIEEIADDFAKPSRPKLLPDWSQVCTLIDFHLLAIFMLIPSLHVLKYIE